MKYQTEDGKLVWNIKLTNQTAMAEMVQIADKANHRPGMLMHKWNQLQIALFSSDVGQIKKEGLFLVEKIDKLLH